MSRRGRHGHHAHSHASGRPIHHAAPAPERPAAPADGGVAKHPEPGVAAAISAPSVAAPVAPPVAPVAPAHEVVEGERANTQATAAAAVPGPVAGPRSDHAAHPEHVAPVAAPAAVIAADARPVMDGDSPYRTTCTSAQLRRFIKSRPWVPLHELRRRFGISGDDDDVSPIRVGDQRLFIGLPPAEARLVGELLSGGDVGYELSLDPTAPIVVGVYPMRPVPRG